MKKKNISRKSLKIAIQFCPRDVIHKHNIPLIQNEVFPCFEET